MAYLPEGLLGPGLLGGHCQETFWKEASDNSYRVWVLSVLSVVAVLQTQGWGISQWKCKLEM